ncbi:selenoprotein F [Chelonus insularis]|uniref:selenoprotein F n=1 Tax=Chelonus insularis TaxID=460826 RepID=UPI00158F274F|nr:selenoprotein F [Chelonus insularis]
MVYLYFFILIISLADLTFSKDSPDDCLSRGFTSSNLLCSTCEKFDIINEPEMKKNCKQCCLEDESRRYPKAILEVCTCKFGAYPQIQAFVKSDRPKKYKNLSIKYARGADPTIRLYNHEDKLEDVLDIHKWDTDSVDEFLRTHLIMD